MIKVKVVAMDEETNEVFYRTIEFHDTVDSVPVSGQDNFHYWWAAARLAEGAKNLTGGSPRAAIRNDANTRALLA